MNSKQRFVSGDEVDLRQYAQRVFHKLNETQNFTTRQGRMCFKSGDEVSTAMTRNPRSAKELSADIYGNMKAVEKLYQQLQRLSGNEEFEEMIEELAVVTHAMAGITKRLGGSLKEGNPPQIVNFCQGLDVTKGVLRTTLADIRRLLRTNEQQSIDIQLLIISLTLTEHLSLLKEMPCK